MVVDHWQFDSWRSTQYLTLTKSLIIQVPPQTNLSLHQFRSLSINLGFSFPVLSSGWKVFLLTMSIPYDLSVFFPSPLYQLGGFFINWSLVQFSSSIFSSSGWEVFHQRYNLLRLISFFTGLGCFQWSSGFPPQSPSLVGRFFTRFPFPFNNSMLNGARVQKKRQL